MPKQPISEMLTIRGGVHATRESIEADFWAELAQIKAESIGWIPLGEGAYLHVDDESANEVLVVGVAQVGDAVLLVG
jgi:hypothetical protein